MMAAAARDRRWSEAGGREEEGKETKSSEGRTHFLMGAGDRSCEGTHLTHYLTCFFDKTQRDVVFSYVFSPSGTDSNLQVPITVTCHCIKITTTNQVSN
jgi:hypothetical protein